MDNSNFDKYPEVVVQGYEGYTGWNEITDSIWQRINQKSKQKTIVTIECYHGVIIDPFIAALKNKFPQATFFSAASTMLSEENIAEMVYPFVTDDPVFGYMTSLQLADFFDTQKLKEAQEKLNQSESELLFVFGTGATFLYSDADLLIYADMPRWEIQLRFRKNEVSNLGASNNSDAFSYQYKRAFFVDWRVCDKHKVSLMQQWDFALDTTKPAEPKMVSGEALLYALEKASNQPFRVVPFFDPGPWGGQWLKEVCDLDRSVQNFAWGFDCVPEENSLLFRFGQLVFETPSINLVFFKPEALLGNKVYDAFGAEFPIRFDFLDTMEGGNLSLQVHPLKAYIREKFGMAYTQDESYYFLEADKDAFVYLGLKNDIVAENMINDLQHAQDTGENFDAEQYVEKWPIKKHDHVLIPSGTVHCSGANSVVLEISATPFIFTFKLWDWGRMGLDGKPRPISLEHGKNAIQWNRTTEWVENNLLDQVKPIQSGEGYREESTGLDETSFIETRRHWFTNKVHHHTNGTVNILNLIEGREAIVESPDNSFEPFVIHYAETFIVPAKVGAYTVSPYGESEGKECGTIKAFVRTEHLNNYRIN